MYYLMHDDILDCLGMGDVERVLILFSYTCVSFVESRSPRPQATATGDSLRIYFETKGFHIYRYMSVWCYLSICDSKTQAQAMV